MTGERTIDERARRIEVLLERLPVLALHYDYDPYVRAAVSAGITTYASDTTILSWALAFTLDEVKALRAELERRIAASPAPIIIVKEGP